MNILLDRLSGKHFKGITNFSFKINGKNVSIFGDNGTGKTTQFDEFLWLLFGKDSTDRSAFKIKPQDADGNDLHMLQTEVEATLFVDGKPLKLKKMQEEKWAKKHGSSEKELTGNTIFYWWDEEPVKEGDYKKRIGELIDESIFRMITNPMYFNTKVKWEDRRKILLEMCGNKTDEEVIESDEKLAKLTAILAGKSIDAYKKVLADKLKGFEKERADIPPRIDELMLTLPQEQTDYSTVEQELHNYRNIMSGIELDMTNATNTASAYRKKQQEFYGLKGKLEAVKIRIDANAGSGHKKLVDEKSQLQNEKYQAEANKNTTVNQIQFYVESLEKNATKRQQLLDEWKNLNAELSNVSTIEFIEPDENSFSCSACGQSLPTDDRIGKLEEMRVKFDNNKKSNIFGVERSLEKNKVAGLALKQDTVTLNTAIERYREAIAKAETRLIEINTRIAEINGQLEKPTCTPDYTADTEYSTLQSQIEALQAVLEVPVEDTTANLLQNKREIQEKIDACNKILNSKTTAESTRKRVEELKAEEKRLAKQITELEGHKYLLEQFVVAKVNMLEENINSHFQCVKFKMFDQQVNGGINECCDALVDGVPFVDANHAGKMNAGLDIINALCKHYDVTTPIFIDGRESVIKLIDIPNQIISLVVSEKDKLLKVVIEE